MRSVLDDAKKVTTIEVLSDHQEKETSEVVPIDHHEKKTSEIVSEIEIVTVSEKETNEVVLSEETSEVVSDDHHEKKTSEIVTEIEIVTVSEKETNEIVLSEEKTNDQIEILPDQTQRNNPRVVFVLGGPGGGKSTQCANLAKQIGFTHLSSGELLREAGQCHSENGPMIEGMMKEGKSVPPDVTMRILQKAIDESGNDKFLLDGFPRDEEIRSAFESASQIEPELVLLFNCSEEEREKRILSRNQERVDDNPDTLRKRFKYFEEHTLPVVEYYRSKGKVTEIDAAKPMEEVFEKLKSILNPSSLQEETTAAHCKLEKEMLNLKL